MTAARCKGAGFWLVWTLATAPLVLLGSVAATRALEGSVLGTFGLILVAAALRVMARTATAPLQRD